jgi:hypothetical protein
VSAAGRSRRGPQSAAIPRRRAAAVLLLVLLLGAGLMAAIDTLRHDTPPIGPLEVADPRTPIECPVPRPREGEERPDAPPARTPVAVTSAAVLDCPEVFDGRLVRYRGEVVGQALGRGSRVWLQVNDDDYAGDLGPLPGHAGYVGLNGGLGVRVPRAEAATITWRGGPGVRGDLVEVHGRFRRVDPASGEMAVIDGAALTVLEPGGPLPRSPQRDRQVVAYVLVVAAAGLLWLRRRRDRA